MTEIFILDIHFSCGSVHIEDPRCKKWGKDMTRLYPDCCEPICLEFSEDYIDTTKGDDNKIDCTKLDED